MHHRTRNHFSRHPENAFEFTPGTTISKCDSPQNTNISVNRNCRRRSQIIWNVVVHDGHVEQRLSPGPATHSVSASGISFLDAIDSNFVSDMMDHMELASQPVLWTTKLSFLSGLDISVYRIRLPSNFVTSMISTVFVSFHFDQSVL